MQALIHSPVGDLQPKVEALTEAGIERPGIAKAIKKIPAILGLDLEAQIMPTLEFLQVMP